MQIWKKNFLTIYGFFLVIIYGGLFCLEHYITQNETRQWAGHAGSSEKSLFYLAAGLREEELSRMSMKIKDAAKKYQERDIWVRVRVNDYIAADYLPEGLEGERSVEVKPWKDSRYLLIQEERNVGGDTIEVTYAESMKELAETQQQRLWMFSVGGVAFSGFIGILLYYTMKKINRPVSQIAHEIRTPLTGIRGYAEYIMMGKLKEEDIFFAAKQIVDSAKNLEDVTEKLLIMGNVREGDICVKQINLNKLLDRIGDTYSEVLINCRLEYLNGDETLISCLLENLIANASKAGKQVRVKIDETGIFVWNDGKPMDAKLLRSVNRGQDLSGFRIGKHGYGIQICREIAMVHGWKLYYHSGKEEGTTAMCKFR